MLYQQIANNKRKSVLIVLLYVILFVAVGAAAGYYIAHNAVIGIIGAIVFAAVYTSTMLGSSIALTMRMNHAVEVFEDDAKRLHNIVEDIAMVAGVPKPRVFVIETDALNAFATGLSPKASAIAITTGLYDVLNRQELEGVIAHEMAHIKNYDVRLQTIAVAMSAVISMIAQFALGMFRGEKEDNPLFAVASVVVLLLSMFIAPLVNLAISRNREYLADATAVEFTRNPQGLIGALVKISNNHKIEDAPALSSGMYIMDVRDSELFSTHPKIEKRLQRLHNM